ncbi:MAG: cobamide remodeling phosphodiesterase CbiR [Spirochaetes bacterium]|nr:cobamide remodeling phosphodiesterase CbiR [Spirochaetota bacterium]
MRISAPSWVVPGSYAENVRFLSEDPRVEGVELLFFHWDGETRDLFRRERAELETFAQSGRFAFTAHLPDTADSRCDEVVELASGIADSFVVHPPRTEAEIEGFVEWYSDAGAEWGGRFFLENTMAEAFDRAAAALPDAPICFDTGHVLLEGGDPAKVLASLVAAGREIREIHIHGMSAGHDHGAFGPAEPWLLDLAPHLVTFEGILEIEVFSAAELGTCIESLRSILRNPGSSAS